MNIVKSLLIAGVLLTLPLSVSAQAPLQQSNDSIQPQSTETQNTGTLQNQTPAPLQTNGSPEPLTQNQPGSLGVVGDPDQSQPSIEVGASDTTNAPGSTDQNRNYLPVVTLVVAVAALTVGIYVYRGRSEQYSNYTEVPTEETAPETVVKPKKKSTANKPKKKKKKAHR